MNSKSVELVTCFQQNQKLPQSNSSSDYRIKRSPRKWKSWWTDPNWLSYSVHRPKTIMRHSSAICTVKRLFLTYLQLLVMITTLSCFKSTNLSLDQLKASVGLRTCFQRNQKLPQNNSSLVLKDTTVFKDMAKPMNCPQVAQPYRS